MTYNESYEKLRHLYSEKAVSYDSLTQGKEIENLVNSLMREIANPLALVMDVRIGNSTFDGEILNVNNETILYDVLIGRLSAFRYRSLSNLAISTYFPQKTYILVIARNFSNNDRKLIADLIREVEERSEVRFAFISHKELISLHKFCVKMNDRFNVRTQLKKVKRVFLELILGSEQIIEHKSFSKHLNLAVKTSLHDTIKRVTGPKKEQICEIDLREISGDGEFPCPKCGNFISPDDESEENYRITETEFVDDELSTLTLLCSNCKIKIRIVGFSDEYPIKASVKYIKRTYHTTDESRRSIQAYLRSMR